MGYRFEGYWHSYHQLLWELLAACPAARLLTRDRLLLRKGRMRQRVLLPEAFDLTSARVA